MFSISASFSTLSKTTEMSLDERHSPLSAQNLQMLQTKGLARATSKGASVWNAAHTLHVVHPEQKHLYQEQ